MTARVLAPVAVVAGMATELAVLGKLPGQFELAAPIMAAVCVFAAATLAVAGAARVRKAALGGFSGRESEVSIDWVADGTIRYVLGDGEGAAMPNDGRTGSRSVMAAIQDTFAPVSSVDGLYDCSGAAAALAALA